jgi:hypothetical protein
MIIKYTPHYDVIFRYGYMTNHRVTSMALYIHCIYKNEEREKSEGHIKLLASYVSLKRGSYPEPEKCSLARVFNNDFVDSRQTVSVENRCGEYTRTHRVSVEIVYSLAQWFSTFVCSWPTSEFHSPLWPHPYCLIIKIIFIINMYFINCTFYL